LRCCSLALKQSGKSRPKNIFLTERRAWLVLYLISDALPFGRLWYAEPDALSNAIDYARFFSRSHELVIRVYNPAGNLIHPYRQQSAFREP
jgi:hypothetical protein